MLRLLRIGFLLFAATQAAAAPDGRVRVIDGDTFDVGSGGSAVKVRLFGVDAPEGDQRCTGGDGRAYHCGAQVTQAVRARYEGRSVTCQRRDRDRYGRIVAVCFAGDEDIGRWLVSEGLAVAFRRYSMRYDLEEKQAFAAARGLWQGPFLRPERWRAEGRARQAQTAAEAVPEGCRIKGNISGNGRIYHMPGQEHYGRTRISEGKGERWFCSEAEARAAGWRRARR